MTYEEEIRRLKPLVYVSFQEPAHPYDLIWSKLRSTMADKSDLVNHPPHYTAGSIEHIEYVEDREGWALGYCLGNATKYLHRAGLKTGAESLEDLKKARWYLDRYIQFAEKGPAIRTRLGLTADVAVPLILSPHDKAVVRATARNNARREKRQRDKRAADRALMGSRKPPGPRG